jgi:hypothetical protein
MELISCMYVDTEFCFHFHLREEIPFLQSTSILMGLQFSRWSADGAQGDTLRIALCLHFVHYISLKEQHSVLGTGLFPLT